MEAMREEFEKWWGSRAPDERKGLAWEAWKASARAEREACAHEGWMAASSDCEDRVRAAIRARGEK